MKIFELKNWLDERLSISTLAAMAQKKEVPVHRQSIWYYFGGMTLFLFTVQVATGILLLLYYRPSSEIAGVIPIVGRPALRFLRGGDDVTGATLTRFFGFHVAVLPATATVFIAIHVLLVQLHGMHVPQKYEHNYRRMKFVPNFILRDLIGWILAIGVLAALAALFPWELGEKADAFAPAPAGIKPEWYFLFMFQTLKLIPAKILGMDGEVLGIMAFNIVALLLFVVPFIDPDGQNRRRHIIFNVVGVFALLYIVVMTVVGYVAK